MLPQPVALRAPAGLISTDSSGAPRSSRSTRASRGRALLAAGSRALRIPECHPGRTIAAVGLLLGLAYAGSLLLFPKPDGRIVVGDAVHYYVYLRSAVYDRDLHFRNEYVRLYRLRGGEPGAEWIYRDTVTGHVRNLMSIGPALFWVPAFLVVSAGVLGAGLLGVSYPLDGFGRVFQASAGFSGLGAGVAGAWLAYRLCAEVFGPRVAVWSTLTIWLGTSAVYYTLVSPAYAHATSMLTAGALFWVWVRTRADRRPRRYALLGALAGLAALVRWQDAVFLLVPVVDVLWATRRVPGAPTPLPLGRAVVNLAVCGAAALATFSPQMLAWRVLYGRPLTVPQGPDWMRWTDPHLLDVLFSDRHGLFTWTPILAIAVAGCVLLWRKDRHLGIIATAVLVASWYVNAAAADWWAGEAYGARRFVSGFPLFALGLAAVLHRCQGGVGRLGVVCGALIALNLLLLLQYQLFMHGMRDVAPYPSGWYGLLVARFVVPVDLLRALWPG